MGKNRSQPKKHENEWGIITLQGTNISPQNGILKMIFLFPRWDMLIPWRVLVIAHLLFTAFEVGCFNGF